MGNEMEKDWNKRAEKNPYHYVSSFRAEWDDESFYRWGEIQTRAVIDKFLQDQSFDPADKTCLEIGCGAGRMSRALAHRFKFVYAYDVSERYIEIARKNVAPGNVRFLSNNGSTFPEVQNESIDFAFSGWTMLHMPTKEVVVKNIREIARCLRGGGLYKIDPTVRTSTLANVQTSIVPRLPRFLLALGVSLRSGRIDKLKGASTYVGVSFTEKEITRLLSDIGLSVSVIVEEDGSEVFRGVREMSYWLCGRKLARPAKSKNAE